MQKLNSIIMDGITFNDFHRPGHHLNFVYNTTWSYQDVALVSVFQDKSHTIEA